MSKIKAYLKKSIDIIAGLLMGLFWGICTGGLIDHELRLFNGRWRYPYRAPFDKFSFFAGLFLTVITLVLFTIRTVKRKAIDDNKKVERVVITISLAFSISFIVFFLWLFMIDTIHDYKRAAGISHS